MKRVISFLSSPKIFLITIFWLMILVVLGTLSQADIGLYESQLKYFSSWVLWGWYFPFPGGRLTLLVMIINLFSFTLKPTFWSIKKNWHHYYSLWCFIVAYRWWCNCLV